MGRIREPGKFEGEPTYVPHLYRWTLEGASDRTIYEGGDEDARPMDAFQIDDACVTALATATEPEVECDDIRALNDHLGDWLVVYELDTGFVCHAILTPAELAELEAECDACGGEAD